MGDQGEHTVVKNNPHLQVAAGTGGQSNALQHDVTEEHLNAAFGSELLAKLQIFEGFDKEERARIYALGEVRVYEQGANIVIEGESSQGLYVILDGLVAIYKAGKESKGALRIAAMSKGRSFGELSLLDKQPRSATVVAEVKSILYYLDGAVWEGVLAADRETAIRFYRNCAIMTSARLRQLDDEFVLSQRQLWKYALGRVFEED